jgi:hypothetical protein
MWKAVGVCIMVKGYNESEPVSLIKYDMVKIMCIFCGGYSMRFFIENGRYCVGNSAALRSSSDACILNLGCSDCHNYFSSFNKI